MLMCAKQMKAEGRLRGNAVVATVMSNIGLELALKRLGIELVRTKVGDKYVMEEMQKRNLSLGGEQSGHLIFSEYLFTGDGLITALSVLRTMAASGRELADLADDLTTYPQVLLNVRVKEKRSSRRFPEVAAVMAEVEQQLGGNGRLLVRYSGTEPLLRVMLEGQDLQQIDRWGRQIVDAVNKAIGERQQGRDAAQLARRQRARRARGGARVRHGRRSRASRFIHAPTSVTSDARMCTTSPSC